MSTLRVNTLQTQAGVEVYTAKAWVNFNGTVRLLLTQAGTFQALRITAPVTTLLILLWLCLILILQDFLATVVGITTQVEQEQ